MPSFMDSTVWTSLCSRCHLRNRIMISSSPLATVFPDSPYGIQNLIYQSKITLLRGFFRFFWCYRNLRICFTLISAWVFHISTVSNKKCRSRTFTPSYSKRDLVVRFGHLFCGDLQRVAPKQQVWKQNKRMVWTITNRECKTSSSFFNNESSAILDTGRVSVEPNHNIWQSIRCHTRKDAIHDTTQRWTQFTTCKNPFQFHPSSRHFCTPSRNL